MDPRLREDDEAAGIPGQPGQGGEGARFNWAAMSSRVAGAKNGAMWARLCKSSLVDILINIANMSILTNSK